MARARRKARRAPASSAAARRDVPRLSCALADPAHAVADASVIASELAQSALRLAARAWLGLG